MDTVSDSDSESEPQESCLAYWCACKQCAAIQWRVKMTEQEVLP